MVRRKGASLTIITKTRTTNKNNDLQSYVTSYFFLFPVEEGLENQKTKLDLKFRFGGVILKLDLKSELLLLI